MFKRRPLGGGSNGNTPDGTTGVSGGGDGDAEARDNAGNRPHPNEPASARPVGVRPQARPPQPSRPQQQNQSGVQGGGQAANSEGGARRRSRRRGRGRTGQGGGSGGRSNQGQVRGPNGGVQVGGPPINSDSGRPPSGQQPNSGQNVGQPAGFRPPGQGRPLQQNRNQRSGPGGQNSGQRGGLSGGPNTSNNRQQGRRQPPQNQQARGGPNQQQRPPFKQPLRRPPPPPPAYLQRGLVLVVAPDQAKAIDEVRAKFDPLVKKIPAHVTLLLPEPAAKIQNGFLRSLNFDGVPSLENLTFTYVEVKNERYLFLVPDEESRGRLKQWHELLIHPLGDEHTQDTEFMPRLTLGYIPRSMTPEDATAFARNLINLPMSLSFEKVMLEEFEENQLSKELDSLKMSEPLPSAPTVAPAASTVAAASVDAAAPMMTQASPDAVAAPEAAAVAEEDGPSDDVSDDNS